ncbi:septum formation initiator family protein [Sphingomonas sp. 1P06PA]|uniref:FtsB family cell division protein n=1 Tax=Sphingomonas sp. 1P06PA TaxID=554121 RepID=UPI0039A65283
MKRTRFNRRLLVSAAIPAVGLLLLAYFVGSAVIGPNGVMAFGDYRRLKEQRAVELQQVQADQQKLHARLALLDPRRGVDPDLADELVRRRTDQVREDEVIVRRR